VTPDTSQYEHVRKATSSLDDIVDIISEDRGIHLITKKCSCTKKNSVSRNLDDHNMLHLMPVAYEAGWEYYHAIAFRHADFEKFTEAVEKLPSELVVLHKSPVKANLGGLVTVTVDDLFAGLTGKQIEALLTSYFLGYFSFPRKVNVKKIAKTKQVPRTTFQEHLTKAENKLIRGLMPYLQLLQQER